MTNPGDDKVVKNLSKNLKDFVGTYGSMRSVINIIAEKGKTKEISDRRKKLMRLFKENKTLFYKDVIKCESFHKKFQEVSVQNSTFHNKGKAILKVPNIDIDEIRSLRKEVIKLSKLKFALKNAQKPENKKLFQNLRSLNIIGFAGWFMPTAIKMVRKNINFFQGLFNDYMHLQGHDPVLTLGYIVIDDKIHKDHTPIHRDMELFPKKSTIEHLNYHLALTDVKSTDDAPLVLLDDHIPWYSPREYFKNIPDLVKYSSNIADIKITEEYLFSALALYEDSLEKHDFGLATLSMYLFSNTYVQRKLDSGEKTHFSYANLTSGEGLLFSPADYFHCSIFDHAAMSPRISLLMYLSRPNPHVSGDGESEEINRMTDLCKDIFGIKKADAVSGSFLLKSQSVKPQVEHSIAQLKNYENFHNNEKVIKFLQSEYYERFV